MKNIGTVYLLHFNKPYKHAQHYIGWASILKARITRHKEGRGARLIEVITDADIDFIVVRTWQGTRALERQLKNQHSHRKMCPVCTPGAGKGRGWKRPTTLQDSTKIILK